MILTLLIRNLVLTKPISLSKTKGAKNIKLTKKQTKMFVDLYSTDMAREKIESKLSKALKISTRSVRNVAKDMGFTAPAPAHDRLLVYDIETSLVEANVWWTGKQYIRHQQLRNEAKIISIAWKWAGQDKVHYLTWDKDHCDKLMVSKFLEEYNKASVVIGQNNNSFDNKWIATRAAKHGLYVDRFIKSFDIMRMAKRYFRLPSFSMAYMAKYFGLTLKQSHEGLHMWHMIQYGTPKEQKEYLKKMVEYNKGDIVTTEELYFTLKPYFAAVTNNAVKNGLPKWACPISGSLNVVHKKTNYTEAGTVQRILYCKDTKHQFKVTNKTYIDYLQRAATKYYE